jgi:hypothetical protein
VELIGAVSRVAIENPSAETDSHPHDPNQENKNVDGHALVVAQDMLDPFEGIRSPGNLYSVREGTEVGFDVARSLWRVEPSSGVDGWSFSISERRLSYEIGNVKGSDHVNERKCPVDEQPPKDGRQTIGVLDALDGKDDRRGVETESDNQIGPKGRANHIADEFAALAACFTHEFAALAACLTEVAARELHALAATRAEFADGFAKDGSHVGNISI